ncbi:BgTH12-04420 [Blumeria graminis f. sp. triticale]|uniref:Non-structural maintenance of chromosomes element 1 homolog n=1 Tax=Blumeria graminis f. sp. triticale TaxID=1689686 RepID=A0A9W4GAR2_BLUGR|nr:BgTH12-04420 [Blumeria graminis f. sp. triticale]
MDDSYNDANRAFLQALMARGSLSLIEGRKILAAICSVREQREVTFDDISDECFDKYIRVAADAVSRFDYEIRSTQHQITKQKIYAFVNSISDSLTQIATARSPDEILYIKRLMDAIFIMNNTRAKEVMAIKGMQALGTEIRKGSLEKGLTHSEAEKLLKILENEEWLERSTDGFYSLAPRALMELRSWLVDTYNEPEDASSWQRIKFCKACKEIVTVGQRCADLYCNVRLHNICETAYWKSRSSRNCPKCKLAWNEQNFVGIRAITHTEKNARQKGTGRGTKRVRDNEDEIIEEDQSDFRPRQRKIKPESHQSGLGSVNEEAAEDETSAHDEPEHDEDESGDNLDTEIDEDINRSP